MVTASLAGCGSPSTPDEQERDTPATPAGTWSGSISDPALGDGTLQLSLAKDALDSLSGTWSAAFKNGDTYSGPAVSGIYTPNGWGIMMYVQPPPPCASVSGAGGPTLLSFTLINVLVSSARLTAASGVLACNGYRFGSVSLSK